MLGDRLAGSLRSWKLPAQLSKMKKLKEAHLRKVGHEGGAHLSEAGRTQEPKGCPPLIWAREPPKLDYREGRGHDLSRWLGCSVRVQVHCAGPANRCLQPQEVRMDGRGRVPLSRYSVFLPGPNLGLGSLEAECQH